MDKYLEFIKKVLAISQIGLSYSEDKYALDNYKELKDISKKMLSEYINIDINNTDIYQNNYYPTPQLSVRALICKDNKILFCKEVEDNRYSLPGGWVDIDKSPKEAIIKEVKEESGYDIKVIRLLAVIDRRKYLRKSIYDVIQLFFLGEIIGGDNNPNFEISNVEFYDLDNLPELSSKTKKAELDIIMDVYKNKLDTYFE